jgi:D-alanyl-D-alanine carboxypeptidase/D-alanyl-D-alanine-endopeptidase (penicillin-binding protein 4)
MTLILSAAVGPAVTAQEGLPDRIHRHMDEPAVRNGAWGVVLLDEDGSERYGHNADQLFVPASNTKRVVTAVASALLPPEYRARTSIYASAPVGEDGVVDGDLIVYGRGDPTFSHRCYGTDTTAVGVCDSLWQRMDALASAVAASGVRHIRGGIIGDGSYFEPTLHHPSWGVYNLNWWYAAPVSALVFNDNSLDLTYAPGAQEFAPVTISIAPDLGLFLFENRTHTLPAGTRRTIDFFRHPGTAAIWAEGGVPADDRERKEYFAVHDPNLVFAAALRRALARRGISAGGPTKATTDPTTYAAYRETDPIAEMVSRPLADMIFPILNSSQNLFAESLLKQLAAAISGEGSWEAGLELEKQFLIDSVGVDSTAFALADGSGLSNWNLFTPRTLATVLHFMRDHPTNAGFLAGLPRSGELGSLRRRFVDTPLEGRVVAKTGSIANVNTLSGYIERPDGRPWVFSVMLNNHTASGREALAAIDSIVVELGR